MKTILSIIVLIWIAYNLNAIIWQHKTGQWEPKEALRHTIAEIKSIFK